VSVTARLPTREYDRLCRLASESRMTLVQFVRQTLIIGPDDRDDERS
jgi:hypothetical protein